MKQESTREISTLKQTIAELERKLAMANRGRRKPWIHASVTKASISENWYAVGHLQAASSGVHVLALHYICHHQFTLIRLIRNLTARQSFFQMYNGSAWCSYSTYIICLCTMLMWHPWARFHSWGSHVRHDPVAAGLPHGKRSKLGWIGDTLQGVGYLPHSSERLQNLKNHLSLTLTMKNHSITPLT